MGAYGRSTRPWIGELEAGTFGALGVFLIMGEGAASGADCGLGLGLGLVSMGVIMTSNDIVPLLGGICFFRQGVLLFN